ncbi:zinc finger protein 839 isoform X6 [Pezoporus occidentalis]|uniref:zinc finger protein 839 isoform X6 n=1 Tax=Pezoporus occidentalis TaxID=407982 RepID=UPI002F90B38A
MTPAKMAAPEEEDTEAPPPPPPAEDKPPGGASTACGAPLSVAAAEEEDGRGAVGPANPPPSAEGPELLATAGELAQSLAAVEAGSAAAGTVLYVQEDGSVVEGERLSAVEVRLLLEQLLAAADSPSPGTAEPPPPRHAATPLAPAEVQRVIEQLEAIRVQVQSGQMKETERPVPSLAPIQPKTVRLSQSVSRNSNMPGLGIINPQIIRLQPVTGTKQQQQLFLHSSSKSPVQLLMQKPLPSRGSASLKKIPTSKMLNGQKATCATGSAARSPNVNLVSGSSANTLVPCLEKNQKDDKLKKSLKVKTRSGRISRPPKYKAKDYKFIKMEDLAYGHRSDSDDYSELSVEDDEEGKVKGKDTLFHSSNYDLNPKTFQCQTCEKSYLGKGGLTRHYKLNPGHRQLESSPQKIPLNKPNGSILVDNDCGIREEMMSPAHLDSVAATLNKENALTTSLEGAVDSKAGEQTCKSPESRPLLAEQQKESSPGHQEPVTPEGPGRPRRSRKHGRLQKGGRSRCSGRLSRPGQSPSKSLSSVSAERNVYRKRKARLKELIQQCDNEDLMELALPRLTKVVTVFEFLLMKVEKGYPGKAYFPDVYKEFEDLHNMVKKMAYRHLSNSNLLSCQQPVEIRDAKVAESLGITEILAGQGKTQGADSSSQTIIKTVSEQVPLEILGQKRLAESSGEELLPSAKRTKLEDVMENVNNDNASQDEVKEKSENLCTLSEKDGFNPLNGEIPLSEDGHMTCCTTGSTLLTAEQHNSLADSGVRIDAGNSATFSQSVETRAEYSECVAIQGSDLADDESLLHEVVLPAEADGSPGLVQAHFVSEDTAGGLSAPQLCSSVSEGAMGSESRNIATSEENGHHQKYQKLQEENCNFAIKEHSEQLYNENITDEMQGLEKALSTNIVPVKHTHSAQTELNQSPAQEASVSAHVNHENSLKNASGTEEQHELENRVTVDETVAFEITDESCDFLSQGHEQIFTETSDGLMSRPDTAVLSQAEDVVIVTDSNGITMHIPTPEGMPLETVETLLEMEADGQSADDASFISSKLGPSYELHTAL